MFGYAGGNLLKEILINLKSRFYVIAAELLALFRPDMQSLLTVNVQKPLQEAVAHGVTMVFWAALIASIVCLFFSYKLPSRKDFS